MENLKQEFDFVPSPNEISLDEQFKGNVTFQRKSISVPALDGVSLNFTIRPKVLGNIDIKVTAITDNAGDSLVRKLLVKPEGQTQYFNKAWFVSLNSTETSSMKQNFSIQIPQNAVPGSVRVKVSGVADILGPTLNNLDDLLRMPYGCGEQNMM